MEEKEKNNERKKSEEIETAKESTRIENKEKENQTGIDKEKMKEKIEKKKLSIDLGKINRVSLIKTKEDEEKVENIIKSHLEKHKQTIQNSMNTLDSSSNSINNKKEKNEILDQLLPHTKYDENRGINRAVDGGGVTSLSNSDSISSITHEKKQDYSNNIEVVISNQSFGEVEGGAEKRKNYLDYISKFFKDHRTTKKIFISA